MKRESGATMAEYILMVALIAIALVAGVALFQGALTGTVNDTVDCMSSISAGSAGDCAAGSSE